MNALKAKISKNLILLLFLDSSLILISFILSIFFRFDFQTPELVNQLFSLKHFFILIITKIFCFLIFDLYRGMWRYTSVWDMFNIFKANLISTIILTIIIYNSIGIQHLSRSVLIIDLILCSGLISFSRLGIRMFFSNVKSILGYKNNKNLLKNILLIGAGDTGQIILRQILQNPKSNLIVAGILDDDRKKIGQRLHGIPILGPIESLDKLNIKYEEIYICIPSASRSQMSLIIDICKNTNKPFKTLPSFSELMNVNISLNQFRDISLIDLLGREEVSLDNDSINEFIRGKRVLITGAGGSIGSELVRQCAKFEPSVLVMVDSCELNLFEIDRETQNNSTTILFKPVLSDIRDSYSLENVFEEYKPQVVFHAAAYKHVPLQESFPWEAVKTNIFGTLNVVEASVKNSIDKFVLVSTDKAVRPANVMGATKRIAEMIIQNFNIENNNTDFMAVRFGNVLGSSGSVIPIFKDQIKNGGPVTVTDPEMERYFMSIPEASQLILQAGSIGVGGEVLILDMGSPIKIVDIATDLIRLSGYEPNADIFIKFTGSRPGEKKAEELSLPSEKLDDTKHKKIFVLNDKEITKEILSKLLKDIQTLKSNLSERSENEVKISLSSILPEYETKLPNKEQFNKLEAEA